MADFVRDFVVWVLLPTVGVTILVSVLMIYEAFPSSKRLVKGLAWGLSQSRYFLTMGHAEGGASDFYFDMDLCATDPGLVGEIASWYERAIRRIQEDKGIVVRRLAFIEKDSGPVGSLLLAGLLVGRTGIPAVVVRNQRRLLVNTFKEKLPFELGDPVVVVSDVATSGRGLEDAIKRLWIRGATVVAAVVLINRGGEKLRQKLLDDKIDLISALDASVRSDLEVGLLKEALEKLQKGGSLRLSRA